VILFIANIAKIANIANIEIHGHSIETTGLLLAALAGRAILAI
jgi:hypothetical protein